MFFVKIFSHRSEFARGFAQKCSRLAVSSALLVFAFAAASFAESHAAISKSTPLQPAQYVRACTQLELSAELHARECGSLSVSEVALRLNALQGNGDSN
ncbi:hypothetical protein OEZ71_19870 [Defluviimonas sp. WL0050]|uniref:Secreted protein n=1 Tax=Albidovulum litorale TaxID=2984134 RepID=A0ABT2ZTU7_9RHOB|nr:hypothetical protein [Defluviimonas sp. WL0050]MCV2874564.1 hypothetical protein [Defluviimonas sp. WL0050]